MTDIAHLHKEAEAEVQMLMAENERLRAQIAGQGFIIQQTQIDRDTWRSNYHGVAEQHELALMVHDKMADEIKELREGKHD